MTRLVKFANNAVSRLAGNITNIATTLTITPGDGAKFPALGAGEYFPATLVKADGTLEIVKVTARSTDTLTIERAIEPVGGVQTAHSFSAGDKIELRLTAGSVGSELDRLETAMGNYVPKAGGTMTGALGFTGAAVNEAEGDAIASATTVDLDAATGNFLHITGTTAITTVTLGQGRGRTVVFDGALTLTNGANLILPTGANITTAAGDVAVFRGEGTGVTRCVAYTRASGQPLVAVDLSSYAPLASPTLTGTPTAPTATPGTNTAQIATTAFVQTATNTQPSITIYTALEGANNNVVWASGLVTALALEVGDVIRIQYSGYNKLHSVESIISENHILVNFEHAGNRGNGSLKLPNTTTNVTFTRIAKWYNAPVGLGQAWVNVTAARSAWTNYTNTTGRPIEVAVTYLHSGNTVAQHAFIVSGVEVGRSITRFGENEKASFTSAIVPAGASYSAAHTAGWLFCWAELR